MDPVLRKSLSVLDSQPRLQIPDEDRSIRRSTHLLWEI